MDEDGLSIGCGCLAVIVNLIFWAVVIFVAAHFILRYW